jgi:hypothetical protein
MKLLHLTALATALLASSVASFAASRPLDDVGALAGESLERLALEDNRDPGLALVLEALKGERGIVPRAPEIFTVTGTPGLLLLPLLRPDRPEAQLYLYYLPASAETFFLQITTDPAAGTEVRLWGRGSSEILISPAGARLLPEPSASSFRLAPPFGLPDAAAPKSLDDILTCIARTLGLTINATSLQSLLSSTTCAAANTLALIMTAFNCLNPTPIGLLACTVGIAKIISCSIANCSNPPPSSCQSTITLGQSVNDSWTTSCTAVHRSGRYARYYTFTLTSATSLQIDLGSNLVDSYLILLRGADRSGTSVAADDDGGPGWNSRILGTFPAGTYTIEATTYYPLWTGSFTLALSRR